ncbi:hypothetical protein Aperf_G00000020616 [Anoplocephala perfoliata]
MSAPVINLDNFEKDEFSSVPFVLTSPKSLRACRQLSIRPSELIYLPLDYFETKFSHSTQLKCNEMFANYENRRQKLIETCRKERNRLILLEEGHQRNPNQFILCGTSIGNVNESKVPFSKTSISEDCRIRALSAESKMEDYQNNKSMLNRKEFVRERSGLLRRQETEKQKQAQKVECCRLTEQRSRLASQMRQQKPVTRHSQGSPRAGRYTQIPRNIELAKPGNAPQIPILSAEGAQNGIQLKNLKEAEEAKRIATMETARQREANAKRVAEAKETHLVEARRLAQEASRLREEIRRTYQLDSSDKVAKDGILQQKQILN